MKEKIKSYGQFIVESRQLSLSFTIDNLGYVDILGRKYNINELIKDYSSLLDYVFVTYLKNQLIYDPITKKFREKNGSKIFQISPDRVVYRSVKVKPSFITGMQVEDILKNTKGAVDSRQKTPYYVEILDINDDVIKSYSVNRITGELE